MFDYIKLMQNMYNHDERVVANDTVNNIKIDTCLADDMGKDYETGLCVDGCWYIIEDYDTKKEAKKGHQKYVDMILKKELKEVTDIYNSFNYTEIKYE